MGSTFRPGNAVLTRLFLVILALTTILLVHGDEELGEDADEPPEADVDAEDNLAEDNEVEGDEQMSAEKLMEELDLDKDQKISLAELWEDSDEEGMEDEKAYMEKIFKATDKNGDG